MNNSGTAPRFAPIVSDDRRIDVATDGAETQIKMSSWVDGLGWCVEKTISLDSVLVDDLHRLLAAVRISNNNANKADETAGSATILEFPRYL